MTIVDLASLTNAALVAAICFAGVIVHRLYLHPLAKIPGPRFAAISLFYEWYSDCIQPGTYSWKIQEWHKRYGPIVRIGPNEVHIDDPDWFDVLFNVNARLDKDPWYYNTLGHHMSSFATVEYDVHRVKRHKQNPFFSRTNVEKSASTVTGVLTNLFNQFERYRGTGNPVKIRNAFKSYTTDVICYYCFASGVDFVKNNDFSQTLHDGQDGLWYLIPWFRHFPVLAKIMNATPGWIMSHMDKGTQAADSFMKFIDLQVGESIRQSNDKMIDDRKTIIRELYESDMPAEYRTRKILEAEGIAIVGAGVTTTARTLETAIFHILDSPEIAKKLTEEVRSFKPEAKGILTHRDLENLPFLSAIVLEAQRIVPPLAGRIPRVNRNQDMFYKDVRLPKGTTIGMSSWDILLSDTLWGDGMKFEPYRWLDPAYKAKMQKHMVNFLRGSRNCVGQNLAVAMLYTVLGNFFRNFDAELFETDKREIEIVQDCFVPMPYKGSVGVSLILT